MSYARTDAESQCTADVCYAECLDSAFLYSAFMPATAVLHTWAVLDGGRLPQPTGPWIDVPQQVSDLLLPRPQAFGSHAMDVSQYSIR